MLDILSCLQAFSADQYRAMQTPQVQSISLAKRESLTMAQQDAIKSVIDNDPDEEDPWSPDEDDDDDDDDCSGTPPTTKIISLTELKCSGFEVATIKQGLNSIKLLQV